MRTKREEGKISEKQRYILEYIASFLAERGYPPSVREIGQAVGLRSPSTVHAHLKALREAGYLDRTEHKTRALSLTGAAATAVPRVPILRKVTGMVSAPPVEEIEGYLPYAGVDSSGQFYALRIRGDSMTGAGILDGDLIIVQQAQPPRTGQLVAALLEGEAACRRLSIQDGAHWLLPEHPDYPPVCVEGSQVLGVVVAVHREYAL